MAGVQTSGLRVPFSDIFSKFTKFAKFAEKTVVPLPGDGAGCQKMPEMSDFWHFLTYPTPWRARSLVPGQITKKPLNPLKSAQNR